jgi:hypothetical protein
MNIYFLVEGRRTEKRLYRSWLSYLIPKLKQVEYHDQVSNNNYFLISGGGYPQTLTNGIENAKQKIEEVGTYNYFVICLDADEVSIEERKQEIADAIRTNNMELGNTKLITIIQNPCIETWLLGNRNIFDSLQSQQTPLSDYTQYYNVCANDPELMGNYDRQYNRSQFHFKYLQAILKSNNISYTKRNPRDTQKRDYLQELINRIQDEPQHLKTFQEFLQFCDQIAKQIHNQSC